MSSGSMNPQGNLGLEGLGNLRKNWGWLFTLGVAMIVIGVAAICLPIVATLAIEIVIGWLLIAGGIVHGIHAFSARQWGGGLMNVLAAILYVVVGFMLLAHPVAGVLTLTILLASFFFVEGIFKIIMSLEMRSMTNWGWLLASGLIALALSAMIWMGWPATAAWVIGLLVGIDLIFGGWAMVFVALSARGSESGSAA